MRRESPGAGVAFRNEKSAKRRFFLNMVGRAGYHSSHPETRPAGRHRWRCKIAPGDFVEPAAGSHPARLSTVRRNEKSAKRRFFLNMVGRAGYHSSHPETRPVGRHRWRCKIAPGDFVEPAAGSHPARLSTVRRNEKSAKRRFFLNMVGRAGFEPATN